MAGPESWEGTDSSAVPEYLEAALSRFFSETDSKDGGVDRARYETTAGRIQEMLAEHGGGHNEIDTWTGEKIRPLDPDPEKINLEDIAHGLSNVGRFAGQGREFYSVARHSVHVSLEVEARGGSEAAQRYALVHDAAEAYLSDVPGPVKKSLPGYKHAERRLDRTIVDALDLEAGGEEKGSVECADGVVNEDELAEQFPDGNHDGSDDLHHDPDAVDTGADDKILFLRRARELEFE